MTMVKNRLLWSTSSSLLEKRVMLSCWPPPQLTTTTSTSQDGHCQYYSTTTTRSFRRRPARMPTTRPPPPMVRRRQRQLANQQNNHHFPHDKNNNNNNNDTDLFLLVPCNYKDMNNTSLATLGAMENHVALEEMLKRQIMATDKVNYQEASRIFLEIEKSNHQFEYPMAFPFQVSIVLLAAGACLSIPMVFHLPTVEYFNEHFVTADHPQPKELETALEVGSWSWQWMEPVLGTSTFVLLCMQYMR